MHFNTRFLLSKLLQMYVYLLFTKGVVCFSLNRQVLLAGNRKQSDQGFSGVELISSSLYVVFSD